MGLDPAAVNADQPLNTLGLDSLMAMELKNNLEGRLALSLPMAKFFEGPSVNSLAEAAVELIAGDGQAAKPAGAGWSPLAPLRRGDATPALFCVHPLGGDVRCYQDLAKNLAGNWPVYALRAKGAEGFLPPHQTMAELVADYIEAIRGVQPEGPYCLAGWSAGGIYAMELGRALLEQGQALGLLAMFDTPLPSICDDVDLDDEARFLYELVTFTNRFTGAKIDVSYETLRSCAPEEAFLTALEQAKREGVVPAEASPELIRRLCEVGRANVRLIMHCRLRPIDHEIVMYHPERAGVLAEMSGQPLEADLGWSTVEGQRMTIVPAPGDHFTMMVGANAARLAELLSAQLEKAAVAC
jgi:thioesterase domain-containing protein/acyl carrier protein